MSRPRPQRPQAFYPKAINDQAPDSVMHDTLGLPMRRSPTAADILAADEYFAALAGTGSLIKRRW